MAQLSIHDMNMAAPLLSSIGKSPLPGLIAYSVSKVIAQIQRYVAQFEAEKAQQLAPLHGGVEQPGGGYSFVTENSYKAFMGAMGGEAKASVHEVAVEHLIPLRLLISPTSTVPPDLFSTLHWLIDFSEQKQSGTENIAESE